MINNKIVPINYVKLYGYIILSFVTFILAFILVHFKWIIVNPIFFNEVTKYSLVILGFVMTTLTIFISLMSNHSNKIVDIKRAGYPKIYFNASTLCMVLCIILIVIDVTNICKVLLFPLFAGATASACTIIYYLIRIGRFSF